MTTETLDHHARKAAPRAVRVLIIDDDERLQDVVREFLQNYGYEVFSLGSGKDLDAALQRVSPDILLLDVMMPGDDGFTILRELRRGKEEPGVPVIMLTACGEDTDRIVGLEIGADDYLPKPFNPRELLARIKAVLRRAPLAGDRSPCGELAGSVPAGPAENPLSTGKAAHLVRAGSFTLDAKRQRLLKGEAFIDLSTTEYRLLHAFMTRPDEALSRDRLLSLVFGDDHYVCDRNIDVYISRIRAIMRRLGENEIRIRTVWGSGYGWVEEP